MIMKIKAWMRAAETALNYIKTANIYALNY